MKDLEANVRAAASGDLGAFGRIVERFQDMAYGYAHAILGDFHLAQDAAQEAFIEAYRNLPKLRDPAAFPGWFRRVVYYRCTRLTRGRRVSTTPLDDALEVPDADSDPVRTLESREVRDKVTEAIRSLSRPQREVTTLFYVNGYSQRDIADFLEVPVNTVKSRLHASRKHLEDRMIDMVQQTFEEHRLPEEFTGRVIDGVPVLAWDRTGNTTFIAAVSAALAVTDRPFDYDSLIAYSGLAFRLRYARRKDGRVWSTVGPVGQFEEEVEAVCDATGCRMPWERDPQERKRRTVSAIDAGHCPVAYIKGDSGVIYGYEGSGEAFLVRCYDLGDGFHRMSFEELLPKAGCGPFFLEPVREPLTPEAALLVGLRMGVRNWRRGRQRPETWQPSRGEGKWEFCFGEAAHEAWVADLRSFESLSIDEQSQLYRVHSWMAYHLYDARLAAARFLRKNCGLLGAGAHEHLVAAAQAYDGLGQSIADLKKRGEAFRGPPHGPTPDAAEWPAAVRAREIDVLAAAEDLDAAAVASIEEALRETAAT